MTGIFTGTLRVSTRDAKTFEARFAGAKNRMRHRTLTWTLLQARARSRPGRVVETYPVSEILSAR